MRAKKDDLKKKKIIGVNYDAKDDCEKNAPKIRKPNIYDNPGRFIIEPLS